MSMDKFCTLSDPFPRGSFLWPGDVPESSSVSDDISGSARPSNCSDEEVLLASKHPKKRAGRKKFHETRHPVYRGVRQRTGGKWVCEVRQPNKKSRIWLGTFPAAEMAARANDVAAIALQGRLACLNFADAAWRLPIPASADPEDIQKTAAEAAEAFRALESDGVSGRQYRRKCFSWTRRQFSECRDCLRFANMAEGLMLPPPLCVGDGDGMAVDADTSLWSYSI